ncbi:hypothetical protein [Pontixanthobacter aquaemixtae]|uniref:Uncharacterized protein n=1 Tax=Pontixanthobacter aquaemixtae TaxID=1958940 RepID=A0A844ZXD1_9SPHN|nr:hypothetical protein [Pontixanthobacter aquaemixtae]MXO91892.1 hypothetical protein [Pontixanthobacter aquaemixtae]
MKDRWIEALSLKSATREKILEHRFIAEITSELWRRGLFDFTVSHSEVDDSGYDLILELGDVMRHIQLKAKHDTGRTAQYSIQTALTQRPSGCVIVMIHDPKDLSLKGFRFLGNAPGKPLGGLGDRVARHTKGNSLGEKGLRPALRAVSLGKFEFVENIAQLAELLFGPALTNHS